MVQRPKFSIRPIRWDSFPKTTLVFDWLHYVVEQTETLIWESKRLIFGLGFALFLIYELAHFAKFLVHNWHGG